MSEFITSFGDRIRFIPGYREMFGRQRTAREILARPDIEPVPLTFKEFVKDRHLFGLVMDFLDRSGIPLSFGKTLEIGAGEGTFSRFLKGTGRAEYSVAVDIQRRNEGLPTHLFWKHQRRFELLRHFNAFSRFVGLKTRQEKQGFGMLGSSAVIPQGHQRKNTERKVGLARKLFYRVSLLRWVVSTWRGWLAHLSRPFGGADYFPRLDSEYYKLRIRKPPEYDDYIITDIYKLGGAFDTIFAVLCLEYFDTPRILQKISDLLVDGGLFVLLVNSWWYPRNATEIVGDFPYACQRLTREDFERYLTDCHPGERESLMTLYDYFAKDHPTLNQYTEAGFRVALTPILANTISSTRANDKRAIIGPSMLADSSDAPLEEVLMNIHRFRTDVTAFDLMSKFYFLVFRRRSRKPDKLDLG